MNRVTDTIIQGSFYLLFLLVPLWFNSNSSELFEYNKMMLTYGLTIVIVAAWLAKMVVARKFIYRRTFLEIPLILYLASHLLSTIFSLDPHTSIFGYYSRFHEGLLATVSYILLYFAAVSNLNRQHIINTLKASFVSAAIVSIYGALEHFGHSPSCLLITGKFDVDCWVQDVKGRVFATLGQPNWMAAYLNVVILTALGWLISPLSNNNLAAKIKNKTEEIRNTGKNRQQIIVLVLLILYFCSLLFTKSRSGILGLAVGLAVFGLTILYSHRNNLKALYSNRFLILSSLFFLLSSFVFGLPFTQTEKISLENFLTPKSSTVNREPVPTVNSGYIDIGISESGDIRRIVWKGAIKIWQRYPVFGSGVETFAYAYYKDRPVEHNMVSEWDFLYNKAHNEFLNILATTGTIGFLSYLSILGVFILWFCKLVTRHSSLVTNDQLLVTALFAAWTSILVTNFFGFSVVIIGLFFFLIPAFCFLLASSNEQPAMSNQQSKMSTNQWVLIGLINLISLILLINLVNIWQADKNYAYGKNLDSVQRYVDAYPYLRNSVNQNPDEPTFRDEFSYNEAVLAGAIFQTATGSAQEKLQAILPQYEVSAQGLINRAISDSDQAVESSPNVMPFWKTRTRMFYQLATIDPKYSLNALAAIEQAKELAPTDAKVHYNLGILLGRTGQTPAAIKVFEETVAMKPDYRDAYYALALYYDQTGDRVKARQTMRLILSRIGPDTDAQKWLDEHR